MVVPTLLAISMVTSCCVQVFGPLQSRTEFSSECWIWSEGHASIRQPPSSCTWPGYQGLPIEASAPRNTQELFGEKDLVKFVKNLHTRLISLCGYLARVPIATLCINTFTIRTRECKARLNMLGTQILTPSYTHTPATHTYPNIQLGVAC